ncbi:hypothetical protein PENSPDRAFT_735574 [Peniophora sp. CONT]|nr:hypothetical protein PENSPDRAFT_735574 [Peniophora sp. CONT]
MLSAAAAAVLLVQAVTMERTVIEASASLARGKRWRPEYSVVNATGFQWPRFADAHTGGCTARYPSMAMSKEDLTARTRYPSSLIADGCRRDARGWWWWWQEMSEVRARARSRLRLCSLQVSMPGILYVRGPAHSPPKDMQCLPRVTSSAYEALCFSYKRLRLAPASTSTRSRILASAREISARVSQPFRVIDRSIRRDGAQVPHVEQTQPLFDQPMDVDSTVSSPIAESLPMLSPRLSEPTASPAPPPASSPEPARVGRRIRQATAKVREAQESEAAADAAMHEGPFTRLRRIIFHVHQNIRLSRDAFGLSRSYRREPTRVPDLEQSWKGLTPDSDAVPHARKHRPIREIVFPYPSVSHFLYNRFWKRSRTPQRNDLDTTVFQHSHFDHAEFFGQPRPNYRSIEDLVAKDVQSPWGSNGWGEPSPVYIDIPTGERLTKEAKKQQASERRRLAAQYGARIADLDDYRIHRVHIYDVHHRNLVHVLHEAIEEDPLAKEMHFHGFEETWQPPYPGFDAERVLGEVYSSDEFLHLERDMLATPPVNDCKLPRVIAALMFWSDGTHLAQFGQAKAWPIYLFLGNLSKYTRCKPSVHAAYHIAYLASVPDSLADKLQELGVKLTPQLSAHCKREAFHEAWRIMLADKEFKRAYEEGIVMVCADGIQRRVYPRMFSYSADYPEKVLIATTRDMGDCPCPRCKVRKSDLGNVGTTNDARTRTEDIRRADDSFRKKVDDARDMIYRKGYVVDSKSGAVGRLKEESLVPTVNAFSQFSVGLERFNFDVFLLLVVDLMHEFELGVWKALLIHLIRILHSLGTEKVRLFNERFRQISTFKNSTIRSFTGNVSDMKKLAARDFEDILQCCIPCFAGLLEPEHDKTVSELLYLAAYWHSLAKSRMHTDTSLRVLDEVTVLLAKSLRHFAEVTCKAFPNTVETDKEYRARCEAHRRRNVGNLSASGPGERQKRTFNLATYKLHALGDYVAIIRQFGTTDSYSTQIGELEHRIVKLRYGRTNRRNVTSQLVKLSVLETIHERMNDELEETWASQASEAASSTSRPASSSLDSSADFDEIERTYGIANDESNAINVSGWLLDAQQRTDPAFEGFERRLKQHLLARQQNAVIVSDEPDYTEGELRGVILRHDQIYRHATATFNYHTYDVRRDQDRININNTHRDVMLFANEDSVPDGERRHPFWYARVLGIYHANVFFGPTSKTERVDFLFVRWFGVDPDWAGGPRTLSLDRVGYVPQGDESGAFGFLDPARVIRACHLIPAFHLGKTTSLLHPSRFRDAVDGDWGSYYISRFVDRDMSMRYLGFGVGHRNKPDFPHEANDLIVTAADRELQIHTDVAGEEQPSEKVRVLEENDEDEEDGENEEDGEDGEDGEDDDGGEEQEVVVDFIF